VPTSDAPPAVLLRRGTPQDLESFWRCLDAVARERRWLALVAAPPLEEARAYLDAARAQGMIQVVAVAGPEIVGWCDVIPKPYEGHRHTGSLGMGLLPAYRGRGLGARLLEEALRACIAQGLTRIELEVYRSNRSAIALYERRGFVHEGCKRRGRLLDGQVDDVLCMALLSEPT
jgi:ribosomal protein S18 acetylase RimI-like enzyme